MLPTTLLNPGCGPCYGCGCTECNDWLDDWYVLLCDVTSTYDPSCTLCDYFNGLLLDFGQLTELTGLPGGQIGYQKTISWAITPMDCTFQLESHPDEDVRIDSFDATLTVLANFLFGNPCRRRYSLAITADYHLYSSGQDDIFTTAYGGQIEKNDCALPDDLPTAGGTRAAITPSGLIWPCNSAFLSATAGRAIIGHTAGLAC